MSVKPTVAFAVLMGLASAGALTLLFSVMRPDGVREYEDSGKDGLSFPSPDLERPKFAPSPALPETQLAMPAPAALKGAKRGEAETSSLDLLRKEVGAAMERQYVQPAYQPPPQAPAPQAPQQTPQDSDPAWTLVDAIPRSVEAIDPRWRQEFNANKILSGVRARYEASRDFTAFLHALDRSSAFHRMLAVRSGRAPLRQIVDALFADEKARPSLRAVFIRYGRDPVMRKLILRYGSGSLPPEILEAFRHQPQASAERKLLQPKKLQPRAMQRINFSGSQNQAPVSSQNIDPYKAATQSQR